MKTFKILLAAFLLFTAVKISSAQESSSSTSTGMNFQKASWAEVLTMAKEQNKFIFVDCFADWCGPCKWMDANVFPTEAAGNFYNDKFITYKLDMEKGEGVDFAQKYAVNSYPTYIFFNSDGEPVHRAGGSKPVEDFIKDGENAINPDMALYSLQKKYEGGERGNAFLYNYAMALMNANIPAHEVTEQYISTLSGDQYLVKENWEFIYNMVYDVNSPAFKYLEANKQKFVDAYGKDVVDQKIYMTKTDYYMYKRDWTNYSKTAVEMFENKNLATANALNAVAWTFYENISDKKMLKKALGWAKESVKMEKGYANTDTYAALLYKLGNYEEALKVAKEAIELAKKEDTKYDGTTDLIRMIKAKQDE